MASLVYSQSHTKLDQNRKKNFLWTDGRADPSFSLLRRWPKNQQQLGASVCFCPL